MNVYGVFCEQVMRAAAQYFVGEHDFRNFCKVNYSPCVVVGGKGLLVGVVVCRWTLLVE